MKCFLKIHSQATNQIIGVCDEDCINLRLKQGEFNYHVSDAFFRDNLVPIEEAIKILEKSSNFNAVGKNIIKALIETKIIPPEGVLEIDGIPIAIKFLF
ncbi:DUF424 family protein [Promethearchaeum syntrophicum]|uniref:DUF424 family protein n=1 Tax=Promethearchaeum syntrophicum TaxID=2594042 RepID=A0A5B9D751_9ARCH|nr:DUF424 family protein [Candidatus Prometheoarchaeum syntrophicum]QEE14835.1 hypothetical protein DSAG12_00652 [Candidatus Prometheoarchaeum syntrophicum]